MGEKGWLKTVLDGAKADYESWPEWMRSPEAAERIQDADHSRGEIREDPQTAAAVQEAPPE
jgi:hypothetical protein